MRPLVERTLELTKEPLRLRSPAKHRTKRRPAIRVLTIAITVLIMAVRALIVAKTVLIMAVLDRALVGLFGVFGPRLVRAVLRVCLFRWRVCLRALLQATPIGPGGA